jgi:hypothetical protein
MNERSPCISGTPPASSGDSGASESERCSFKSHDGPPVATVKHFDAATGFGFLELPAVSFERMLLKRTWHLAATITK